MQRARKHQKSRESEEMAKVPSRKGLDSFLVDRESKACSERAKRLKGEISLLLQILDAK